MSEGQSTFTRLRREHPIFFWGTVALLALLLVATTVVATRIPAYSGEAALIDRQMDETERETRDRILQAQTRRSELALALLQREMRLKSLQEKNVHLSVDLSDSTLSLRHGSATLREIPIQVGPDSIIRAPDGKTWRFVRALGERHLKEKLTSPDEPIPEWVYVARGQPVPPEEERRVKGAHGRYVLRLDDGTEIYSEPKTGPFAETVKPGGFMARERDLRVIFDALKTQTPVYIY